MSAIPADSPQVSAAMSIIRAVKHPDPDPDVGFDALIDIHTHTLDNDQLRDVVRVLAGFLYLVRDALREVTNDVE